MTTPTDIRNQVLSALAAVLDEPLKGVGFARKRDSLTYLRTINEAEQQITFAVDCFPKCQPGAEAHIHPSLQISMPRVNAAALELVKGDKNLLAGAPSIILNQPIDFTAPKDKHERWFATGEEQIVTSCKSIKTFLWCWVLPFLAEVSTPADVVNLCAKNDTRVLKQKHWFIFVAAAYQVLGQLDKVREVVRQNFGSPGLRTRYAPLFASLGIE